MARSTEDSEIVEKIFIIKELLLEGKTLEQIAGKMRRRKEYNISGFDVFMKTHSEKFKDIIFTKRSEKKK